jgi:hypothetical protein
MRLTKEAALLLDCSRILPNEAAIERMRAEIKDDVNWGELLRLAIPHGLLPVVAHNLALYAADIAPTAFLVQLEAFRNRVEQRNRGQISELLRIVADCAENRLRVLPFKGPLLAISEYKNLGLRESHDLDVWVAPGSVPLVGARLRSAGYRGVGHKKGLPYFLDPDRGDQQTEFLSRDGEVLIELHDQLQSRQFSYSPDFDEVWNRRTAMVVDGIEIPTFAPVDLLLTLAVHGSKHMWRRLGWVVDIAAWFQAHPGMDWKAMLKQARRWHCKRRLLSAVLLADDLYELSIPEPFQMELHKSPRTRANVIRIQSQLIEGIDARTVSNFMSELTNHVENADSLADRLRIILSYLKKVLRLDESEMLRSMPRSTLALFRMSRSVRILLGRFVQQD